MISATVEAGDSGTQYLNKKASELQDNIKIVGNKISGTLHKIESFLDFSNEPSEQSGHYLVLTLKPLDGASIETRIGDSGKSVKVTDGYCIYRVKNTTQKIYVTTDNKGDQKTKIFDLSNLNLEGGVG